MEQKTEPARVLQYIRVLDNGGIEKLVFNYLEYSDRDILNYDFLLIRDQVESYEDELKEYGCRKIIVPKSTKKFIVGRYLEMYRRSYEYFKKCPYKIVHFQAAGESFGGALPILAAKRAGIPVRICHAHSAPSKTNVVRRVDEALGRICHRRWATQWFACSKIAAEYSYGKKWLDKVEYVRNAINPDEFEYNEESRVRIREKYGLKGKFVIGNIGRLSPPKNHIFMIDMMAELVKRNENVVLLIVGGFSATHEKYAQEVKEYISQRSMEKYVLMVGEQKDTQAYLSAMDLFLFPSLWEGLGIAAIEAQANGLPILASERIPEEARITDMMIIKSLNDSAAEWSDFIFHNMEQFKRHFCVGVGIASAGYDIKEAAIKLQNRYLELLDNVSDG